MREWFKARNIWGAAILALSDAEAGRLMKGLWQYTMTGEDPNLSGAERAIFALISATLGQDEARDSVISGARAAAGSKGGKQKQANKAIDNFATADEANAANATNKNKNKNIEEDYSTTTAATTLGNISIDPLIIKVQKELIGLTDAHYDELDGFRQELGDDLVSHAIDAAVGAGVRTWSYVSSILRRYVSQRIRTVGEALADEERRRNDNNRSRQRPGKQVTAQQYEQRDYDENELEKRLGVDD